MEDGSCLGPRSICYSVTRIHLCEDAIISQGVHLCAATHNYRSSSFSLQVAPILVERHAWIAADAFVGPGVTIGAQAVVGARSVVVKDVESASVVAGNPAIVVGRRHPHNEELSP
jgi:putative colanic acid biosynthesis acetyltransferase WcaF